MSNGEIIVEKFGNRNICIEGVGILFYQEGLPLSVSVSELNKKNIEVSLLHIVEELWSNGWSWKTIERKFKGELDEDIDKVLKINFNYLEEFYKNLEQPERSRGGYEKSREMIFEYLFNEVDKKQWLFEKLNQ